MQHSGGQFLIGQVRRAETENIRIQNGFGAEAGAQRVTNDAADTGGGAAVRFHRRGVVVGLDLETERPAAVKINHPGVIDENREAPRFIQLAGGLDDGTFEQIIDRLPV